MDFKNVHHLREILVTDTQGKTISTMQYSSQNSSHFRPNFLEDPLVDQARARKLYLRGGGRRRDGMKFGLTTMIPMHSGKYRKHVRANENRLLRQNRHPGYSEFT